MKVSVLISVYAKEKPQNLRQSLDSIFGQTLPPDEVVLVEDGPLTPELNEVITHFAQQHDELTTVRLKDNKGLGLALREGVHHCSHDWIARMDSDDISMDDRLERQAAYLSEHEDIDILGGWVAEFISEPSHIVSVRKVPEQHEEILRFSRKRNPLNHPTVMFRKQAVLQAGNYRDCPLFEDYDLWVRLFRQGARFHNLQAPLLYFRMSQQLFNRRGGGGYMLKENRFQWSMMKMGHIGIFRMVGNMLQRMLIRVLPNKLREKVYLFMLR